MNMDMKICMYVCTAWPSRVRSGTSLSPIRTSNRLQKQKELIRLLYVCMYVCMRLSSEPNNVVDAPGEDILPVSRQTNAADLVVVVHATDGLLVAGVPQNHYTYIHTYIHTYINMSYKIEAFNVYMHSMFAIEYQSTHVYVCMYTLCMYVCMYVCVHVCNVCVGECVLSTSAIVGSTGNDIGVALGDIDTVHYASVLSQLAHSGSYKKMS